MKSNDPALLAAVEESFLPLRHPRHRHTKRPAQSLGTMLCDIMLRHGIRGSVLAAVTGVDHSEISHLRRGGDASISMLQTVGDALIKLGVSRREADRWVISCGVLPNHALVVLLEDHPLANKLDADLMVACGGLDAAESRRVASIIRRFVRENAPPRKVGRPKKARTAEEVAP